MPYPGRGGGGGWVGGLGEGVGGLGGGQRLNDCIMKHYIVLNMALFSHAHVTISAEIKLTHACSRGEASLSNCHSRLRAFVGMASWNWETVLKV